MGYRIEDLGSAEFSRLFTDFEHTAFRLELLQRYDVSYEKEPFRAFIEGGQRPADPSKDEWTGMIRAAVAAGKVFQRVHLVDEPLTDYLLYELDWSYEPNVEAGEDIRILVSHHASRPTLPGHDYWLFDSRDLWVMDYDGEGKFRHAERVTDDGEIVMHCYWRDAVLHHALRYRDYMRRVGLGHAD